MNTDHRPKMEDFEDYIFIVLKTLVFNEDNKAACELFEDAKTQLGALERALAKLKDVR